MDLLKSRAYGIFVSEFGKHLSQVGEIFKPEYQPSEQEITKAMTSFHTIRGGAGFFGLSEIARLAGELEELLSSAHFELEMERARIQGDVQRLHKIAEDMPEPNGGTL